MVADRLHCFECLVGSPANSILHGGGVLKMKDSPSKF